MREHLEVSEGDIPEYFPFHDARKPPSVLVDEALSMTLNELFENRKAVEKTLTRNELMAYDHVIANLLTHDKLMDRIKHEIYSDYNTLD